MFKFSDSLLKCKMVRTKQRCTEYERENFRRKEYQIATYGGGNSRRPTVIKENQQGHPNFIPEIEASIKYRKNEKLTSKSKVGIERKAQGLNAESKTKNQMLNPESVPTEETAEKSVKKSKKQKKNDHGTYALPSTKQRLLNIIIILFKCVY